MNRWFGCFIAFVLVVGILTVIAGSVFLTGERRQKLANAANDGVTIVTEKISNSSAEAGTETPTPKQDDEDQEENDQASNSDDELVLLGEGTYINGFRDASQCYEITQSDLDEWSSEDTLILFEGELCDALSVHQIMLVDEPMEINQGSFWSFETGEGDLAEDVLMAFAHDKWQNWKSQGITSLPIIVHFPNGDEERFSKGEEPTLTEGQQELIEENESERCPSGSDPIEETPFSDLEEDETNVVDGAPGSFACITIYIPAEDGASIGYFVGAWDEFPYPSRGAEFYIAPKDWEENDIVSWIEANFPNRENKTVHKMR